MKAHLIRSMLTSSLLPGGSWMRRQGSSSHLKAHMAPLLLPTAWVKTLAGGREVRPSPWAHTWPIARLSVPFLGIRRFVLAGAGRAVPAFGPGQLFAVSQRAAGQRLRQTGKHPPTARKLVANSPDNWNKLYAND